MVIESIHVHICDVCGARETSEFELLPQYWSCASVKTDGHEWGLFSICQTCRNRQPGFFKMLWELVCSKKVRAE